MRHMEALRFAAGVGSSLTKYDASAAFISRNEGGARPVTEPSSSASRAKRPALSSPMSTHATPLRPGAVARKTSPTTAVHTGHRSNLLSTAWYDHLSCDGCAFVRLDNFCRRRDSAPR
mmetsp:Transcript_44036/g.88034  ORF Transcript_44036/g.88034 Transcript_44036/m.88034 type:complete len:118 (-) Transcript_44036:916-1269(-)